MKIKKLATLSTVAVLALASIATVTNIVHADSVQAVYTWVEPEFHFVDSGSDNGDGTQDMVIDKPGYYGWVPVDSEAGKEAIAEGATPTTIDSSQLTKNVENNTDASTFNSDSSGNFDSNVKTVTEYYIKTRRRAGIYNRHGRYSGHLSKRVEKHLYKNSRHVYHIRGRRFYRVGYNRYVLTRDTSIKKIYDHISY